MEFNEVRVGDTARVLAEYTDGTVIQVAFTVTYVQSTMFGNSHTYVRQHKTGRKSLSIELVSRPASPPKVGDLLTGAQVQGLPNHAVFLDVWNKPRTVFNGKSYDPEIHVGSFLSTHDLREPIYRLIYLPEGVRK